LAYDVAKHLNMFFENIKQNPIVVAFDIETVPDKTLIEEFYTEEELAEKENMYQVSLGFHKVVVLSYCTIDFAKKSISEPNVIINLDDEHKLLQDAVSIFKNFTKFVTFNGQNYDLPVLEKRSLLHGLSKSYSNESERINLKDLYFKVNELQNQPWNHFDIFKVMNMKGQKGGLSFLLSLLNKQKYDNMKGHVVETLVTNNDIETLKQYALQDAKLEAELFVEIVKFLAKDPIEFA